MRNPSHGLCSSELPVRDESTAWGSWWPLNGRANSRRRFFRSATVFIVHRLQNPEDLRYFKEIVPGIYGPMLDQIPALAPQTALVLGECVPAPSLVKIRDACPIPRSRDPKFYRYWTADDAPNVPVEDICADWEGRSDIGANDGDSSQDSEGGADMADNDDLPF